MNPSTVILLSLLTSFVVSGGTVYAIEKLDLVPRKEQQETPRATVPAVRGLSEDDARGNLAAEGLIMMIQGREPSTEVEPGHVFKQSVLAGTKLARGEAVVVTIARALPKVPSVAGLSADAAATVLAQAGFKLKVGDGVVDPKVPEGKIAAQTPGPDAPLEKDSVVTVQLSLPPKTVDVPNFVGMALNGAKQKLQEVGLTVGKINWLSLSDRQAFIVMQQDPTPGKKLKAGEPVNLFVNQ